MSKKQSFFQKITGSDEAEGENHLEIGEAVAEEQIEEEIFDMPAEERAKSEETSAKSKKSEPKEEWLGTEGQLTIDVYQTPSEIVIKSTVAGVNPEDIDISISNDMVTIKGARQKDEEVKGEDYYYQECYWGAFSRSVILPVDIEADKAEAAMKNGILTIRLPKIEKVKTRKVKVKSV